MYRKNRENGAGGENIGMKEGVDAMKGNGGSKNSRRERTRNFSGVAFESRALIGARRRVATPRDADRRRHVGARAREGQDPEGVGQQIAGRQQPHARHEFQDETRALVQHFYNRTHRKRRHRPLPALPIAQNPTGEPKSAQRRLGLNAPSIRIIARRVKELKLEAHPSTRSSEHAVRARVLAAVAAGFTDEEREERRTVPAGGRAVSCPCSRVSRWTGGEMRGKESMSPNSQGHRGCATARGVNQWRCQLSSSAQLSKGVRAGEAGTQGRVIPGVARGPEVTTCSGCKCTLRDVGDASVCVFGQSAEIDDPENSHVRCKVEGYETKWAGHATLAFIRGQLAVGKDGEVGDDWSNRGLEDV
ncbi:hypothetical protein DFH09DRAFT_1077856 [Mycena vulgaris]|nr:hypothetical protein DFH09DRAFT_1077856 [Mycena vulgaris]